MSRTSNQLVSTQQVDAGTGTTIPSCRHPTHPRRPAALTWPRRTISLLRSFFTATSLPVERSRQMRTSPNAPW